MSTPDENLPPAPSNTEEGLLRKKDVLASALIEEPKPSATIFTLPCGYLEGQELIREVDVREIDGDAEDMLASNTPPHLKYGQLIGMCTRRIGPYTDPGEIVGKIIPQLTIGDRVFLLFAVRRVSLGDLHYVIEPCANRDCLDPSSKPDDPKPSLSLYTINLADVEIRQMPQPMVRSYSVQVQPVSGPAVTAVFHPMTGVDEARIARFKTDKNSMSILARLDSYGGQSVALRPDGGNIDRVLSVVKAMGISVRNQLRDHFGAVEGGIDTSIQLQCPKCKTEFERELQVNADFFAPSGTLARWKAKRSS